MTTLSKIALLVLMTSLITACGIKPSRVDPPQGVEGDYFPRKYPDINTDPASDAGLAR